MEFFVKIVNDFWPLTFLLESSIVDISLGSTYTSEANTLKIGHRFLITEIFESMKTLKIHNSQNPHYLAALPPSYDLYL